MIASGEASSEATLLSLSFTFEGKNVETTDHNTTQHWLECVYVKRGKSSANMVHAQ
jgi:hypothetical protein